MSEQKRYRIERQYKREAGWSGWIDDDIVLPGGKWQDATQKWLNELWYGLYTVVAETPSEDGQSGIIEIQFNQQEGFWFGTKIKATPIEDD